MIELLLLIIKGIGIWIAIGLFSQLMLRAFQWNDLLTDYSQWFWSGLLGPITTILIIYLLIVE